jgi:hypothetical protein
VEKRLFFPNLCLRAWGLPQCYAVMSRSAAKLLVGLAIGGHILMG